MFMKRAQRFCRFWVYFNYILSGRLSLFQSC